jgi:hypothetical protein
LTIDEPRDKQRGKNDADKMIAAKAQRRMAGRSNFIESSV